MCKRAKNWITLGELRPGAVFVTRDGTKAIKTKYSTTVNKGRYVDLQCDCYLLCDGVYAHFPKGNDTEVRQIIIR